jgi:hypothetical protein
MAPEKQPKMSDMSPILNGTSTATVRHYTTARYDINLAGAVRHQPKATQVSGALYLA